MAELIDKMADRAGCRLNRQRALWKQPWDS